MTTSDPERNFETRARETLKKEISALSSLADQLNWERFSDAYEMIMDCEGMRWITGAGTSSSIARRFAHILTCSGAPAAYLDPGQSAHGYSGIVRPGDLLIAFSRGGKTDEVNHLLAVGRGRGAHVVSILEDVDSEMATTSDVVIACSIAPEYDAEGFIPLSSTLVQAAIGDMLCAGILQARGFSDAEFGRLHPGGAVGKRLEAASGSPEFLSRKADLASIQGFVIDMDGVLWHGEDPLPGVPEFFHTLAERGSKFVLATNNPSKRPEEFAQKAQRFGVPANTDNVITCVQAVTHYLKRKYPPGSRVHVIGEKALKEQVEEAGYKLADENVVAVVVALDRQLTHDTFKRATLLIRGGAEFIGTNADPSYPTEEGFVPGSGMMVIALAATSDTQPLVMGKPGRVIFDLAQERLGLPFAEMASIGDRLDTDIEGGRRLGMRTILILSGIASRADLAHSRSKPDWVFESLVELDRALRT
ncbi:MAG: HAD-IIA family hydrolase [Anaerolineales bacterium]|jgi:4-nitrophenyl phosphatase